VLGILPRHDVSQNLSECEMFTLPSTPFYPLIVAFYSRRVVASKGDPTHKC